ncbi:hypothetical protein [Streptomyces sp. NPDC002537]
MSASPTPAELAAIRAAYAALAASTSPNSNVVETIVYALGAAQMLVAPKSGSEGFAAVFRAEYDSVHLGHYDNPGAARAHCEHDARHELGPTAAEAFGWTRSEDPDAVPRELFADGTFTGYLVRPLAVASVYDSEVNGW